MYEHYTEYVCTCAAPGPTQLGIPYPHMLDRARGYTQAVTRNGMDKEIEGRTGK